MAWSNSDPEPTLVLASGSTVSLGVYGSLTSAQAAGFVVSVDGVGDVSISPSELHEDVAYVIESNSHDVALILADQTGRGH